MGRIDDGPTSYVYSTITVEQEDLKGTQGHSVGYILGLEEEKHGHRITCNRDMSTSLTDFPKSSNTRIQDKFLLVQKTLLYLTEHVYAAVGNLLDHFNAKQILHFGKTLSLTKL